MTPKTPFSAPALMAMTLSLTGCASVSRVPQASLPQPLGILRLQAGQTYTAPANEVWHSAARYQQLELEALDALSALKQAQAK